MKLALIVLSTLALMTAAPALAHETDVEHDHGSDQADERRDAAAERAEERREAAKERMEERKEARDEAREAAKERIEQAKEDRKACRDNETCDVGPRRAAQALVHAIEAHERRIGKLEIKAYEIEQQLAGNLTANQTAELEAKLERIEAHQDKAIEKVLKLKEKLEALRERWAEQAEKAESDAPESDAGESDVVEGAESDAVEPEDS